MNLEETANKLVRDIINTLVTPNYAIKAEQSGTAPTVPYASVLTSIIEDMDWHQRQYKDDTVTPDIIEDIQTPREFTFSLNFFKDGAKDNAMKTRIGLGRQSINDLLRQAGMGLTDRSEIRSISEPVDNSWEERAQFDLVLNAVGTDQEIIRSILAVTIEGEYQYAGRSTPITIEVS